MDQNLYGSNIHVTMQEEDCAIYRLKGDQGETVLTRYQVVPGVALVYNDAHTEKIWEDRTEENHNILEINHCREGRIEFESMDGEFFYIKKGDMCISMKNSLKEYANFPQCHYHGVTIEFDLDLLQETPMAFMEDFHLTPFGIRDTFCKGERCFILHEKTEFEHLFAEIYSVPEKIRMQYYKLKIMEIMLFLSVFDLKQEHIGNRYFNRNLVASVKEVHSYMLEHLDEKMTIDFLAEKFNVSSTNLKKCFREVYGNSMYAYLKETRIHKAAELLKQSDLEIGTIAGMMGYDNASKFSTSFKSIIGITPREYKKSVRMEHFDFFGVEKQENKYYNAQ